MRPVVFERGDNWQVNYFTGSGSSRTEVAEAIVDDATRRRVGRVARPPVVHPARPRLLRRDRPEGERPVRLAAAVPSVPRSRSSTRGALSASLHLDLLVLLGLGVSLFFFNRGEITTSVPLTYPVLGYVLAANALDRDSGHATATGPLVPLVPIRWLAVAAIALACGADRAERRRLARDRHRRRRRRGRRPHHPWAGASTTAALHPGSGGSTETSTGHSTTSPMCRSRPSFRGTATGGRSGRPRGRDRLRPADGDRPRGAGAAPAPGPRAAALGISLAFAWLAYPFTLYTMNANANDSLIAAVVVGAMLALSSPPGAGRRARARRGGQVRIRGARAAVRHRLPGERRWRSALVFSAVFVVVCAVLVLPFLPDGGLREFYDRTLGYQASRSSPFSVWGLAPSLDFLRPVARAAAAAGAGGGLVAAPQEPAPGRRARGGGADRRPARGDALVLLLRRLVPAVGAGGALRHPAASAASRSGSPAVPGSAS